MLNNSTVIERQVIINSKLCNYLVEIKDNLSYVKAAKIEFIKWWNYSDDCPSDISRKCRNIYGIEDYLVRQSLIISMIIKLYSILEDNQSKCFNKIYKTFNKSTHQKIIELLYKPLWIEFQNFHKAEIQRLCLNRNNLFAHISKDQPVNEIIEQGNYLGMRVERQKEIKYWKIEYDDIFNKMKLFSESSFNYLSNLISLIEFSNFIDLFDSVNNNIEKHIDDFKKNNQLR